MHHFSLTLSDRVIHFTAYRTGLVAVAAGRDTVWMTTTEAAAEVTRLRGEGWRPV